MTRRLLSLAISASLLSGCMSLAPEHTRPPLPVAAAFPQPGAPVSAAMPAAAVDWQSFYTDPELRGLIARALINNRDLRMAVLRVEEARAAYGIQRADQFPTLGLAADAVRQRTPG
ncbi:TolC family protein, partial [Bordetella hinzii]|nr:TolC family protein [Bordetella hinzii]